VKEFWRLWTHYERMGFKPFEAFNKALSAVLLKG
jgi:hypothetical protein